jgi:L-Ala-D/L-Glu epimerase
VSNSYAVEIQQFPIAGEGFVISRETKTDANVVYVHLMRNGHVGEGECVPLKRYGHTPESIKSEVEAWLAINPTWSRQGLIDTMPAGPARFALDTAMWQLEAAEQGKTFEQLVGGTPHAIHSAFTLGGAAPEVMAERAATRTAFRWLKIKLMGDGLDERRLDAIHAAAPHIELIVDANEALTPDTLHALLPVFERNQVVLIEQPLPAGHDNALLGLNFPIPFAADESCHDMASLDALVGKYQVANIKLDKAGGLTHALAMKARAEALGFNIMVGCMASTSLSILPAFFLAQDASFIDLDGALLLVKDRENSKLCYDSGHLSLI